MEKSPPKETLIPEKTLSPAHPQIQKAFDQVLERIKALLAKKG